MKPVKTETSNITFVGEGCQDLPGTKYIGIELDKEYFEIAKERIEE